MVFAKKKYPDNWKDKIVEAARNYFKFDSKWTDDHVKSKIKSWEKETKGYQCNGELLKPNCVKPVCVKRKYGVLSDNKETDFYTTTWYLLRKSIQIIGKIR